RQTAIGPTSARLRHPRPVDRRRADRRRVLAGGESDQRPVRHVRLVAHRIPESLSQKHGSRHAARLAAHWNSVEITNRIWVSAVAGAAARFPSSGTVVTDVTFDAISTAGMRDACAPWVVRAGKQC